MTKLFSILILFNLTTFHNPKPKTLTWGFYAHSLINRLAVYSLPSEMFGFYKKNIDYLADNAVNPDKRRYAVKDEAPKHYIDLDVYADSVKKKLPTLFWKQAVELYSEDTLMAYGIVPWQIQKMGDKIKIISIENAPYATYINSYNTAHIVLDQVYCYDQGYNALEAMAKGKVVLTGAETVFTNHYNLTEKVAVNALPDVNYLVKELIFLIENPKELIAIGKRARTFVEKEHDYIKVAKKYLAVWKSKQTFSEINTQHQ